jgi:hypothetical protein
LQRTLFVLLAACGVPSDSTIDIMHDACAPLVLSTSGTEAQRTGIADAAVSWRLTHLALGEPTGDVASLEIRFEKAAGAFRGVYEDEVGMIYINEALVAPELPIVIAHELGHAFGLSHVEGRDSVMNAGNIRISPTDEDREALAALWGDCAAR